MIVKENSIGSLRLEHFNIAQTTTKGLNDQNIGEEERSRQPCLNKIKMSC
jgi:hypothetical protein